MTVVMYTEYHKKGNPLFLEFRKILTLIFKRLVVFLVKDYQSVKTLEIILKKTLTTENLLSPSSLFTRVSLVEPFGYLAFSLKRSTMFDEIF